ncbi:hypothetical protein BGW80DRAFT_1255034 [Lactifluus volemus]|nr:hypothetical protein BGW80DRAFT_1255034 [Lactifluus volemus]
MFGPPPGAPHPRLHLPLPPLSSWLAYGLTSPLPRMFTAQSLGSKAALRRLAQEGSRENASKTKAHIFFLVLSRQSPSAVGQAPSTFPSEEDEYFIGYPSHPSHSNVASVVACSALGATQIFLLPDLSKCLSSPTQHLPLGNGVIEGGKLRHITWALSRPFLYSFKLSH